MQLTSLGAAPANFFGASWPDTVTIREGMATLPLFSIDGAFFFSGADAGARELIVRSGRPFIDFLAETFAPEQAAKYVERLAATARTNYQPIDCNFYDNFEATIVTRRLIELVYLDVFGEPVTSHTKLADLKTKQTEEFVQLASGEWLRLDRIVSVDGVPAGASCRF